MACPTKSSLAQKGKVIHSQKKGLCPAAHRHASMSLASCTAQNRQGHAVPLTAEPEAGATRCSLASAAKIIAGIVPWPSHVRLLSDPLDCSPQAPLTMGFRRQEYWSGWPFPSPGIFPTQGWNPCLLRWQAASLPLSHLGGRAGRVIPAQLECVRAGFIGIIKIKMIKMGSDPI